ncbi:tail protein X [Paraburkholderia sediminicola]
MADFGVFLPIGTPVFLPELASVDTSTPLLQLFD